MSTSSPDGVDGSIRGAISTSEALRVLTRRPSATLTSRDFAARARATSVLMHMSLLCGFPIFLFALIKRDNALVLHHAKAAAVGFLFFYSALIVGVLYLPWLFYAALVLYVPSLIGVWRASLGEQAGALGLGPVGEALFFPLQPKVRVPRQLDYDANRSELSKLEGP